MVSYGYISDCVGLVVIITIALVMEFFTHACCKKYVKAGRRITPVILCFVVTITTLF